MKFDYIIIGGGLSGLAAGIRLAEKGKKTAIVSSGQSALHFCAGTFGLLGRKGEDFIENPLAEIDNLPENHPYRLMGKETVEKLAGEVPEMMKKAGVTVKGDCRKNHFTLTPFGTTRPSWLTLDGYAMFENAEKLPFDKALIVSLKGFLESYPAFIKENLEKKGVSCREESIDLDKLADLRLSNFDMRSVSVAKQIDENTLRELGAKIKGCAKPGETVLIPAVIGLNSEKQIKIIREIIDNPVYCVPTIPVSVGGVRTQTALRLQFERLGGTYLLGDHVEAGLIKDGEVTELITTNFGDDHLRAKAYILASGTIFSEGIKSNPNEFYEPVFGLDVHFPKNRDEWYSRNFFDAQPYMSFGVEVDKEFHPSVKGEKIKNLYAVGSALAHCDALKEDAGAGEAILTALHAAELAISNNA